MVPTPPSIELHINLQYNVPTNKGFFLKSSNNNSVMTHIHTCLSFLNYTKKRIQFLRFGESILCNVKNMFIPIINVL